MLPASLPGICGGTMTLTDSRSSISFSSLIYDNGESSASSFAAECTMHINSQSGQDVQAVLDDIQLINEYVRIYDHPSSSDTEFLVTTLYSTEQARATVFSSQGGLTLVYSANQLTSHGRGFRAEVSILDGIPYESDGLCGGVLSLSDSTPNHTFTTPLYNNPSMDNVEIDFTLHILSPEGKQVQLMFLDISTTTSETISVYDYPQSSSQRSTYISGSVNVEVIVYSSANGLTVVYLDSSDKYNGRGFKAVASVIDVSPWTFPSFAGGTIDLIESRPNATFYTPFYFPSSNNDVTLDILFHILSPAGSQVLLSFIDIATTSNEKISVYDHPFSMSTEYRVAYIYGLLDTGAAFFSTQGGFTVVYDDSSSSSNGPGFRAVARILDIVPSGQSALCGGTVVLDQTTPKLNFSSPLYDSPSFVDVHVDCRIHITSPEGKQVRLNFIYIYTTISESISVYDHPYLLTSRVAFFVGTLTAPSAVYSSSGGLTITYDDGNDLFNGPGYLAEASVLDGLPANETGFCGGTMTFTADSPVVTFATPMYDDPSTSDINMDCTMHFVAPSGSHIQLIFSNFVTTTSEELVVYDHPSSQSANAETSHLWGPLNSRVAFLSSQEGLTLNYIDGSNSFNGPGFKAEVRLLGSVCNGS
ncbi:uncharacterized protein LOC121412965 [Lytechinus variegatus]|uniref:uncharacterized protein LOC121412965 n=1 Tax=Lytechinus variegatus TaxID=7654 RepID=UPI001BB2408A|nr:uncharacterized protein LOC121412965 [Lytechinus variegatus]